jgi:hypothetical protein
MPAPFKYKANGAIPIPDAPIKKTLLRLVILLY